MIQKHLILRRTSVAIHRPFFLAKCAPLILALAIGTGFSTSRATPATGQAALNTQLVQFSQQTPADAQAKTTLTASADDLITALCAVLLTPGNTVSAADLVAGSILEDGGKSRTDRDQIAGRLVDAALRASDASNSANVAAVVKAVVQGNPTKKITAPGQKAAIAAALKLATGTDAGRTIAQQVMPLIAAGNEALAASISKGAIKKVGTDTKQVQSFVNGLFGPSAIVQVANRSAFCTALAKKLVPSNNKVAAGEVMGSSVETLNDQSIQTATAAAINDPVLAAATAEIVKATSAHLSNATTLTAFATALSTGKNAAIRGKIAGGAIQSGAAAETVSILNGARGTTVTSPADIAKFAKGSARGVTDATKITSIANTLKVGQSPTSTISIAEAMLISVGKANPSAAGAVYSALVPSGSSTFGTTIASVVKANGAAVGAIAKAEAATAGSDAIRVNTAASYLNKFQGAAMGVAQRVSELATNKVTFASDLVKKSPAFNQLASSIAVGVAITDPANVVNITTGVVIANATTSSQAASIAKAVGTVVDVEQAANIGATLAGLMTPTGGAGHLMISQASSVAFGLAKAIQKNPFVPTTNRADELGELAAAMVDSIITSNSVTSAAKREQAFKSIGLAIVSALQAKKTPNNVNLKADRREAADIAGSIAQTISVSSLAPAEKQALLSKNGVLAAQLSAAVGAKYSQSVKDAIAEVKALIGVGNGIVAGSEKIGKGGIPVGSATQTGKYEIGSVNDPETPKKNI